MIFLSRQINFKILFTNIEAKDNFLLVKRYPIPETALIKIIFLLKNNARFVIKIDFKVTQ